MKICNKCSKEKDLSSFHKNCNEKDGYRSICKECVLGHSPYKKPTDSKECKICLDVKNIDMFSFTNKEKGFTSSYCKICANKKRDAKRAKDPNFKKNNKKKWLKRKYSISLDNYEEMYKIQEGKCKICDKQKETLSVDHCHNTLKVRGLLCVQCNSLIGMAKDNIQILESSIKYLRDTNTYK